MFRVYTERYMGLEPENEAAYNRSNVLRAEAVAALRDKPFLLIHGTRDDNVHFQQSLLLAEVGHN